MIGDEWQQSQPSADDWRRPATSDDNKRRLPMKCVRLTLCVAFASTCATYIQYLQYTQYVQCVHHKQLVKCVGLQCMLHMHHLNHVQCTDSNGNPVSAIAGTDLLTYRLSHGNSASPYLPRLWRTSFLLFAGGVNP